MSTSDENPEKKDETVEPAETQAASGAAAASAADESTAETSRVAADAASDLPASAAASDDDTTSEPAAEGAGAASAQDAEAADEAPASETGADAGDTETEAPKRRRRGGRGRGAAKTETEKAEPAKPARPAPSRRRAQRDPNAPVPVVRAQAKYVRSSARKARLVCDNIRGKSVDEARAILALTPRAVARDWSKLLESAIANAEHNHELVGEDLYVKAVHADEGPTIKRFRPRAMGRATRIRKRTSHLTILLTPKD